MRGEPVRSAERTTRGVLSPGVLGAEELYDLVKERGSWTKMWPDCIFNRFVSKNFATREACSIGT